MNFTIYLAALGAALCWAVGGMIAFHPISRLGAVSFNRIRMPMVFLMLSVMAVFTGGWNTISLANFNPLIVSGIVGIFLGDTAMFLTLFRLGPRRTSILFATNAPLTIILGYLFLQERIGVIPLLGCTSVFAGVTLAIMFGNNGKQKHRWESVRGSYPVGILLGLFAALCQALALIIAKPVLEMGVEPVAASAVRVGVSALCLIFVYFINGKSKLTKQKQVITPSILGLIAFSGLIGMAIGMTLLLYALASGTAGVVSTLSATTPVIMLPLIWIKTREAPSSGAWAGAVLVVVGTGFIFNY